MANLPDLKRTLIAVERLLDRIALRHPEARASTDQIMAMLVKHVPSQPLEQKPMQRRVGEGVFYSVEKVNNREVLSEHRPSGAPLRVSHELFTTLLAAFVGSPVPMHYDEIAKKVSTAWDEELSEWQGR